MLISVSGIDCSGKTTFADKLAVRIGARVVTFPDRNTPIGHTLDSFLKMRTDLHPQVAEALFFANKCEHRADLQGFRQHVIAVRYKVDAYAYGSVLGGCDLAWMRQLHAGLPNPEVAVLLACDPSVACARLAARPVTERYERSYRQLTAAALALEKIWHDDSIFYGVRRVRVTIDPHKLDDADRAVEFVANIIDERLAS